MISDIDDTIKDTHVRLAGTHTYNPLIVLDSIRPWRAVVGMASFYKDKKWNNPGTATVIYVSAARCSVGRRTKLEAFIKNERFPYGQILLRDADSVVAPHDYKAKAIRPIIAGASAHRFILVGDSGEFDPESYAELAREFSDRVEDIYIRIVSRETDYRFEWAFRGIEKSKIHLLPPTQSAPP